MSTPDKPETVEVLAAIQHEIWAHWMRYFFNADSEDNRERWRRQMNTPYQQLSEAEKESDRNVVRKFMSDIATLTAERNELEQIAESNRIAWAKWMALAESRREEVEALTAENAELRREVTELKNTPAKMLKFARGEQ